MEWTAINRPERHSCVRRWEEPFPVERWSHWWWLSLYVRSSPPETLHVPIGMYTVSQKKTSHFNFRQGARWTRCFKNCKTISTDGEVMSKIKVYTYRYMSLQTNISCNRQTDRQTDLQWARQRALQWEEHWPLVQSADSQDGTRFSVAAKLLISRLYAVYHTHRPTHTHRHTVNS